MRRKQKDPIEVVMRFLRHTRVPSFNRWANGPRVEWERWDTEDTEDTERRRLVSFFLIFLVRPY